MLNSRHAGVSRSRIVCGLYGARSMRVHPERVDVAENDVVRSTECLRRLFSSPLSSLKSRTFRDWEFDMGIHRRPSTKRTSDPYTLQRDFPDTFPL